MTNEGRTYTVYEVADLLGLTAFQVYRRIQRGDLPAEPGRRWREGYRVDAVDLKAYIAAGCPLSKAHGDPEVMRVPEVMKVTGLSDDMVRQLCQDGHLEYERGASARGQYRISRASVEEYMKSRPHTFAVIPSLYAGKHGAVSTEVSE